MIIVAAIAAITAVTAPIVVAVIIAITTAVAATGRLHRQWCARAASIERMRRADFPGPEERPEPRPGESAARRAALG
ncbi:MAG: hypothetical protein IIZ38_11670 [Sphingomonas sp.]|uniref:hypothetical protein n=1 Tax=Sphingomonas sp. TaxID=28214 RepID=UPI0025F05BD3|nr:hypothetical protein [Sphingomonas sp.]MBQ1498962.1 hypothetical protein [Sphingomonas sp.]